MDREHNYYRLFQEFLSVTRDGFIIVDPDGVIIDINQHYCDFLGKSREQVIGRPIGEVISTTSMYDVLKEHRRGDIDEHVYMQPYNETDNSNRVKTYAIANRFCYYDEDHRLLGAAAQMSFKEQALSMANSVMMEELNFYKKEYQKSDGMRGFDSILGSGPGMKKLKEKAARIAGKDFPVLITGETGTGKELFAKAIHAESSRRDKPIISINCAAIPADLLESELFGYEEGAFTGAKRGGKIGKFQLADKGTLFLDEIGDMPLPLQAKLLRVLQEHEIDPVGGSRPVPIDIRVIAATRRNLTEMIQKGEFREDLYYRLNVINLEMIPLRERPEDILLFAENTLDRLNRRYKTSIILSDAVKRRLQLYSWPGNVRELNNVITGAYASCDSSVIDEVDLPTKLISTSRMHSVDGSTKRLPDIVADYEAAIIRDCLRRHGQNCREAAQELGIDRSLLYRKMKKYGIVLRKTLDTEGT